MKDTPLVSVIITCYNYGDYVGDAIDSVLSQTYNNIEIIIIDDGSTDNSLANIKKYKNNPSIKIVSRANKGVIYTRNQGVKMSTGEYIMQLDADDYLDRMYIEECVGAALEKGLDIVYTQTKTFGRVEYISQHIEYDLEKLKHDNYIHAASLVRRSRLGSDPYDSYLDKLGNEDWDIFLDMCLGGARAGLVDKPLLNYRKHVNRKSRADKFEGLYKESLVRHHIWSKQNEKYPDQFWYFSSQINQLLDTIKLYKENELLRSSNIQMSSTIDLLESRDIILRLKRFKKRFTRR